MTEVLATARELYSRRRKVTGSVHQGSGRGNKRKHKRSLRGLCWLISSCCDQNPWQSDLRGGFLWLTEGTIRDGGRGEDRTAAVGVRQSVMVHTPQEAQREDQDRQCSVGFLLFIQFKAPTHKIVLSTLTAILPTSILS